MIGGRAVSVDLGDLGIRFDTTPTMSITFNNAGHGIHDMPSVPTSTHGD